MLLGAAIGAIIALLFAPESGQQLRANLRAAYERISQLFRTNPLWNQDTIGGALSIVVHTAYHLGEIRQALCALPE